MTANQFAVIPFPRSASKGGASKSTTTSKGSFIKLSTLARKRLAPKTKAFAPYQQDSLGNYYRTVTLRGKKQGSFKDVPVIPIKHGKFVEVVMRPTSASNPSSSSTRGGRKRTSTTLKVKFTAPSWAKSTDVRNFLKTCSSNIVGFRFEGQMHLMSDQAVVKF